MYGRFIKTYKETIFYGRISNYYRYTLSEFLVETFFIVPEKFLKILNDQSLFIDTSIKTLLRSRRPKEKLKTFLSSIFQIKNSQIFWKLPTKVSNH